MLRKHLAAIAAVSKTPSLLYRVRQYFLLGSGPLSKELAGLGYSQADLVLCLVRINTPRARRIAETLIGRPITIGPACKFVYSFNKQNPSVSRQPVITWVVPKQPYIRKSTRLGECFCEFKVGRTKQQLLIRGVSNGDIRRAIKRGWIKMAGA